MKTIGQALEDPTTALGRANIQVSNDRAIRLAAARELCAIEGISLEDALAVIWNKVSFEVGA